VAPIGTLDGRQEGGRGPISHGEGCRRRTVHPLIRACVLLIGNQNRIGDWLQVNRNDLYHWQIITHPRSRARGIIASRHCGNK